MALLCPITHQVKDYPFEVRIPDGLSVAGVILADQIKSLDWRVRQAEFITRLSDTVIDETIAKVNTLLS